MSKVKWNVVHRFLALGVISISSCHAATYAQEPVEQVAPAKEVKEEKAADEFALTDEVVPKIILDEGDDVEVFQIPDVEDIVSIQLRTHVAVENALIRRVCKLNAEQLKQLEKFDPKWIKQNAKPPRAPAKGARGVIQIVAGFRAPQAHPDSIFGQLSKAHRKELTEILTPDQLDAYNKAVEDRNLFRKRANAECVVALLDERLYLTVEQRTEIQKQLMDWPAIDNLQPLFYFQNHGYWPTLPNDLVKVLSKSQRAIFEGVQKADFEGAMFDGGVDQILIAN